MPTSAEGLEAVSCLFCEAGTPTELMFADPPFAVVRCSGCGLVFVSPRIAADRLRDVYDHGYWSSPAPKDRGYANYRGDARNWLRTYRRRARVLDGRLAPDSRVLDVGCAAGYFCEVMAARGHRVAGIEPSAAIIDDARARLGPDRVHFGTLDDAPFPDSSFDLVTLWDVVEHLPTPIEALRTVRRLLRDDGLLLLETQNVESRFARILGRRWQHFKQAEHLWHFAPTTLRLLLDAAGFAEVELTARRAGKYVGLDFIAERAGRVHPALSSALAPLARLRAAPYVNLFDEMIVLARPRPARHA